MCYTAVLSSMLCNVVDSIKYNYCVVLFTASCVLHCCVVDRTKCVTRRRHCCVYSVMVDTNRSSDLRGTQVGNQHHQSELQLEVDVCMFYEINNNDFFMILTFCHKKSIL